MSNDDISRQNSAARGSGMRSDRDALIEAGLVPWHERMSSVQASFGVNCDRLGEPCTACRLGGYCQTFDRRSLRAYLVAGVPLVASGLSVFFSFAALADTQGAGLFVVRPLGLLDSSLRYAAASTAVAGGGWLGWLWLSGWWAVLRRRIQCMRRRPGI